MGQTIGNIQLDLGINSSGFKRQLNSVGNTAKSQTSSMAGMFGKLGKVIGAAFAVKKIVDFSKACIQLGSDLAEVQNVVDVTYGGMPNQVNDFAKNAMKSFGLSEKVAKQYMGTFGAMSKAFGFTTEAAYEQAAALTGLAGDVASFYNLTTDEAYTKLKSVFTGETESLKELGVVMTQTALDEYALQKGMGKTTAKMSEQEKVALRLAFVQDRLATASGDFARTSGGWANQTRVLALRFDALKASIGQGLIAALTPVVKLLNELMVYLQAAADAFSNFMQAIFGKQETAMAGAGAALTEGMGAASSASGDLASNSADAAKSAKAIKKSLAGFDEINILSSPSSEGDAGGGGVSSGVPSVPGGSMSFDASGTVGEIEKIRAKLSALFSEVKTKTLEFANITGLSDLWDKFLISVGNAKEGVLNLFDAFKGAVENNAPNFEALKTSISDTFLTISQTVTTIWGDIWVILSSNFKTWTEENKLTLETYFTNVIANITNAITLISDIIGDLYEDLGVWWEEHGKPVFDGFVKSILDIKKWILEIYNTVIAPVIERIIEKGRELWEGTFRPLWQNFLGLVSDVGEAFLAFWNNILKPVVDWIVKKLGPPISEAIKKVVDRFASAWKTIGEGLNGIVTVLRGVMQFITGVFSGDWKKAWEGIKLAFSGVWDAMKASIALPLNFMLSKIESFINAIIKGLNFLVRSINKISFEVPDWVPGIGGNTMGFNLKEIPNATLPRLATGGYVEANSPQLAIIGDNKREGEIVAPESKIAEAVAAGVAAAMRQFIGLMGNKTEQRTPLVIKIGEDDFWSGFIDYHNSVVKRTGDTPLLI
jgi:hypothetical protein